jgi:hypothetical protein
MSADTQLRKGPIPAIVLAAYTTIVLDISIVITGLPKIHHALDFSPVALSWVQNAYLLAFGGLLRRRGCWRGSTVGLLVGGIFTGWLSWRVGSLINIPIGSAPEAPPARPVVATAIHGHPIWS